MIEYRERYKAGKSPNDRREIEAEFEQDMENWRLWRRSIDDDELVATAARMDLSLDDIPPPQLGGQATIGHWNHDDPRADVLYHDSRRALKKAIRERAPVYRKEKREIQELYLKVFLQAITAITGVGGTIIGIIAILKK